MGHDVQSAQDIWLSVWTRAETMTVDPSMRYYMTIYVALGMAAIGLGFCRGIVLALATLRASQARIFSQLIILFNSFHGVTVPDAKNR
jgi:hypothetical protein